MDNEVLRLDVDINDKALDEKVSSIEHKITTLKEKASSVLEGGNTSALPGFDADFQQQMKTWQDNLDHVLKTRNAIEKASNSFDKNSLLGTYKREVEMINRSLADMFNSKAIAQSFTAGLGKELSNAFSTGINSIAPQLAQGLRQTAMSLARSGSGAAASQQIVDTYMKQQGFRGLTKGLQGQNAQLFSPANFRQYLMASIASSVPQYFRGDMVNNLPASGQAVAQSFREMFPQSFQKIHTKQDVLRNIGQTKNGKMLLSQAEQERLFRMIREDRYMADNAVSAGIVSKSNGQYYYNPKTNRDMVNAMAGFAFQNAVRGAKGEAKFGIADPEDPNSWNNIQKKGNLYLTRGIHATQSMHDSFEWLNPGYYRKLKAFNGYESNGAHVYGVPIGRIEHGPKIDARAFAEYTMDMMDAGHVINGINPTINGKILTGVTGPMKKGSQGNPTNRAIRPEDWHTISLRQSMLQDVLEGTSASAHPGHNEFSSNAIYMKLDERLAAPGLDQNTENEIVKRYADRFQKGYTINGRHHSFTRANKTHAEFVPDDILEAIGKKQQGMGYYKDMDPLRAGLSYLRNGVGFTDYDEYQQFAKDQDLGNKMATEGESLLSFMGSGRKSPKVVVSNFSYKDENGTEHKLMDGANVISGGLTTKSFQGRMYGDKATFSRHDIAGLRQLYSNRIFGNSDTDARIAQMEAQNGRALTPAERNAVIQQYGDLIIPGAGFGGGNLVVPYDVDLIEDVANIKSSKTAMKGMTQAEANAVRSRAYAEGDLYAKATYDDALSGSRWIPSQLVSHMNGGFNDPEVNAYFRNVFEQELAKLGDDQYVRRTLFGGDQNIDLTSPEAQAEILNHQNTLFNMWNSGARPVPAGTFSYQMAAPSFPGAINQFLQNAGIALTEDQKLAAVPTNGVMSLRSLAETLGVVRFPATGEGNITAQNYANDPRVGEKVRKLASQLGIDPNGLYFAPDAPILQAMQGEDFDGDLNGVFELANSNNPEFAGVMQRVFKLSSDKYKQAMDISGRTDAQAQQYWKSRIKTTESRDTHPEAYSPDNWMDVARNAAAGQKVGAYMGSASGILLDAWQHPITQAIARGMQDSSEMSDVMSVANKKGQIFEQTPDQWRISNQGHEFGRLFTWAAKAAEQENGNVAWTGTSRKMFNVRPVDELNFPSVNVGSSFDTLVERYIQKRKGRPIDLETTDENGNVHRVFDWEKILGEDMAPIEDPESYTGKMTARLRELRKDIVDGKYLLPSKEAVDEISQLKTLSRAEIGEKLVEMGLAPGSKKYNQQLEYRYRKAGGIVAENLTNGMAITEETLPNSPSAAASVEQLQKLYPNAMLYAPAAGILSIPQTAQQRDKIVKEIEELKSRRQPAEVTKGTSVPPIAKNATRDAIATEVVPDIGEVLKEELPKEFQEAIADPETERLIAEKEQQVKAYDLMQSGMMERIQAQNEFSRLMGGAQDFSKNLFSRIRKEEDNLAGTPRAISDFERNQAIAASYTRKLQEFAQTPEFQILSPAEKWQLDQLVGGKNSLNNQVLADFGDTGMINARDLAENMQTVVSKATGTYDTQIENLNQWEKKIDETTQHQQKLLELSTDEKLTQEQRKQFKAQADGMENNIKLAKDYQKQLKSAYTEQNEKRIGDRLTQMEESVMPTRNKIRRQAQQYQKAYDEIEKELNTKHDRGLIGEEAYQQDVERLNSLKKKTSEFSLTVQEGGKAIVAGITSPLKMLAGQFERQLTHSAINEVKRFVTEYNKSMAEIQMITLKSDDQIATLGTNLIEKAKDMKISVSEITQSAATLYRQGLSDQEVDERLGVISKFSKVSGTKIDAATKLITVAMNTGLVDNAEYAADVVTALGDNAATNAAEIEKGIEKAGAAAAADGTTYGQLVAMLTAITSTTQMGGRVAGTALNSIFGRMNKVGTNELIYDENGNAISGSAVAKLLKAQGIEMYDEHGNKRSSFDTLYSLSQRWEGMSDAERQQIANAIGGTRQYSNFAAIMQGMAEGDIDQYMQLIGESSGITDKKYDIYTKTLEASIANLRSTFDGLINDLTDSGALTGFIDFLTGAIQGVDNLTGSMTGLGASLVAIIPLLAAAGLLKTGNLPLMAVGLGLGAATLMGLNFANSNPRMTEEEYQANNFESRRNATDEASRKLEQARKLAEAGEEEQLGVLLADLESTLSGAFSESEKAALGLSSSFGSVSEQLDAYAAAIELKAKKENAELFMRTGTEDEEKAVASFFNGKDITYTPEQMQYVQDMIGFADEEGEEKRVRYNDNIRSYLLNVLDREGLFKDYEPKIREWLDAGEFIQAYKKTDQGYEAIPYKNYDEFVNDMISNPFIDVNGAETMEDQNARRLFDLIMGRQGYDENIELLTKDAETAISSIYGKNLQERLGKYDFIDDSLAAAVSDVFTQNVMEGVRSTLEDKAAGREADIPGRIVSESERLLDEIPNMFLAENPVEAFEQYVASYIESNEDQFRGKRRSEWPQGLAEIYDRYYSKKFPSAYHQNAAETSTEISPFESAIATGYGKWETANQEKMLADNVLRIIQNPANNISSLQDFIDYINKNGSESFVSLVSNQTSGELGRLLTRAQISEGVVGNQDPALLAALTAQLYGMSSYGNQYTTLSNQASVAEEFLSRINGQTTIMSPEEVANAYGRYTERFNSQKWGSKGPVLLTQEEWARKGNVVSLDSLSDTYLQEILGADLAAAIRQPGRSAENLSLASRLVANARNGISGLTAADRLAGIQDVVARINGEGITGYSELAANQYMQGFAGWDVYRGLKQRQEAGAISAEDLQLLSAYQNAFDNFVKDQEIEFNVNGLEDLEKAGQLLEGTSKLVDQLQRGGEFAIKARLEIQSNLFNESQLDAMLNGNNAQMQAEAVQRILGISSALYSTDISGFNQQARARRASQTSLTADSLMEEYKAAVRSGTSSEFLGMLNGTGWSMGRDHEFVYNPQDYVFENPYAGAEKNYSEAELYRMRQRILAGEMQTNESGYKTALQSGGQEWQEYQRLLANRDTEIAFAKEVRDKEVEAAGANNDAIKAANDAYESQIKAIDQDIENAKSRAEKEEALGSQNVLDTERLDNLRLNSGTVRGMAAYLEEQYRQNNKGAIAADAIFGDLASVRNAEDLVKTMGDPRNKDNWRDLLESSPDLAKKFRDLGIRFDEDSIDLSSISSLTDASGELTGAFGALLEAVQAATNQYTHEDAKTVGERNAAALAYLNGDIYDEESQFKALSQFLGSDVAANEIGYAYQSWLGAGGATRAEIEAWNDDYARLIARYGEGSPQEEAFRKARPKPEKFNWKQAANITDFDKELIEDYEAAAMYGGTGLSDLGLYNRLVSIRNEANEMGGIQRIRENTAFDGLFGEISASVPGFKTFEEGVQILNSANISLKDFSTTNQACRDAFEANGKSIGEFNDALESVDTEIASRGIDIMKKYGKESENVASMYKKLKGTAAEQLEAQKEMIKHQANLANSTYYTSGKGSKNYKDVAKNLLGYDKKDIAALEKSLGKDKAKLKIKQQAELQLELDRQQVMDDANAEIQNTIDSLGNSFDTEVFLGTFTPEMEYDISELAALAAEADAATRAVIDKLLESLAGAEGHVTFEASEDGNSVVVKSKDIKTTGGGHGGGGHGGGGGGGGGGGEKSATDILLDRQKYEQAEAQHKIKMVQLDQEHLDYMNHYDDWLGSLDSEVGAQQELYDLYKKHLDELNAHLGGLEAYSDEWYKVKDAIRAAEEGLKEVINAMDEINRKRVEVFSQKQEQEDKPGAQKVRLWDAKSERYRINDQFESYMASRQERLKEYDEEIALDQQQIEEWENELQNHVEGSDTFNEIVDNIWDIQAGIEEKKNEKLQEQLELQRELIEQWQKDLEDRIAPREHEVNMLTSWGELYQNNRQDDYYRDAIQQRVDIMKEEAAITDQTLEKLREQIKTLDEGTPAWRAATQMVRDLEEQQLQYTIALDEANHAIERSKIDELARGYDEASKAISHQENLLKTQRDRYDKNNNFTMYQAVNEEMIEKSVEKLAELRKQLQGWLDMQGEITEGTEEWDTYLEKVRQTEEEIETEINNEQELIRLRNQSKFQHDQEVFNRQNALDEHQLKMIQYEQSMYQNRGELTNQSTMIDFENAQRKKMVDSLKNYIEVLKEDLSITEEGTDDYYKIADAIYKAEEQVKTHTNAIEKNDETQKKLQETILKTHQTLINTIDNEVKTRVKEQREMLSAEVSIQNQILNIIRNRYKEEFKLVKNDIANKKKALQEEKALINERLQARINAEDSEDKHAQLSELKRQLSLISSDPTRTRDMKAIQEQIDNMEKDLARNRAQDEAKAAQERLDEEMKAYDQYVAYQEEKLNEMLKDANSTALMEELTAVMGTDDMSREDRIQSYMNWIRQNDNNYKYGTEAMRLQMEQANTDSWNKMLGWIDTYWDQVHDIINGGIDRILDYMMDSRSYQFAETEAQQRLQEINWRNQYEAYVDAYKDNADYYHDDNEIVTSIEDEVYLINKGVYNLNGMLKNLYSLYEAQVRYDYIRPTDIDPDAYNIDFRDYAGWGKKEVEVAGQPITFSNNVEQDKKTGSVKWTTVITNAQGQEVMSKTFNTEKEAVAWRDSMLQDFNKNVDYYYSGKTGKSKNLDKIADLEKKLKNTSFGTDEYDKIAEQIQKLREELTFNNTDTYLLLDTLKKMEEERAAKAAAAARKYEEEHSHGLNGVNKPNGNVTNSGGEVIQASDTLRALHYLGIPGFSEGGYVDYTGLAMVHGTPFKQESFLDAEDTANVRAMLDGFKYIKTASMLAPGESMFGGNSTVGDINIVINEAELKSDADLDALATEIGRKFTKQLSKEGLNLAGYSW